MDTNMDKQQDQMKRMDISQGPVFTMDVEPLKQALPSDEKGCLDIMHKFSTGIGCFNTLAYWTLGRIALEKRTAHPEIVERIKEEFRFKTRTIEYAVQLFKRFPEPELVFNLAKLGVSWTGFKNLSAIQDNTERKQLVEKIINEEVPPEEVNRSEQNNETGPVDTETTEGEQGPKDPQKELIAFYRKLAKKMTKFREELAEAVMDLPSMEDTLDNDDTLECDTVDRINGFRKEMVKERTLINHNMAEIPDE